MLSRYFLFFCLIVGILTNNRSFSQESSTVTLDVKPVPKPTVLDTTVDNWNKSFPGFAKLSKESKELLYWTNYSRINPPRFWDSVIAPLLAEFPTLQGSYAESLKATLYKTNPLPLFRLNDTLIRLAQGHASDIAGKKAATGHNSTNGQSFGDRMKKGGIRVCSAENTSLSALGMVMSISLLYLDIGLPGLGHRNTLLNPRYTNIGIGSAKYSSSHTFLVQDFSCNQ